MLNLFQSVKIFLINSFTMKKLLTVALATALLAGCSGLTFIEPKNEPAQPAETTVEPQATTKLDQLKFVDLSAEILCLNTTFGEGSAAAKKERANAIIAESGITEAAFDAYRAELEKDAQKKSDTANAILGRVAELCPADKVKPADAPTGGAVETTPAATDSAAPATAPAAEATPAETKPTENQPAATDTSKAQPAAAQ